MRVTQLFGKTKREVPAEADTASHQILLRAAMIRQVAAGVYAYLPLGWRVFRKIEAIIRDEMDKAGGQEVMLPALQPIELWQQTGRDQAFGQGLFTLIDRRERQLALGPTHEEVVTELAAANVQSYRDLPLMLYQIQTKFRDEPRPRGGLIRAREFFMKDLYSFDADERGLDESYRKMLRAYNNIYARCGLPALMVEADSGAIGGKDSHEFILLTESGEDEVMQCQACGYAANIEKAQSRKKRIDGGEPLPLEPVSTPGKATIEEVSSFLGMPPDRTLKAVFYVCDGALVFAVIRGDYEVNDIKLKNALRCAEMRLATESEVKEAGLVPGAASPLGITGIKIIADDSITLATNLVGGANKPETHLKNINYPRDFTADIIADIARAKPGDGCPRCSGKLLLFRGIEVGHTFKLGTFISGKLGANFVDAEGVSRPIVMGCYGIGVGRLLAAAIEQNHDAKGALLPIAIAPYHVYLCPLYMENARVVKTAEKLYDELVAGGIEVLYDDRAESPGVKFNDADLLGIPLRVTISPRSLEKGGVEVKWRTEKVAQLLSLENAAGQVAGLVKSRLAGVARET